MGSSCTVLYFVGANCMSDPMDLYALVPQLKPADRLLVILSRKTQQDYDNHKKICDLIRLQYVPCDCIEISRSSPSGVVDILQDVRQVRQNVLWITPKYAHFDISKLFAWLNNQNLIATSPRYESSQQIDILHEDLCLLSPNALAFVDQLDDQLTPLGAFSALSSILESNQISFKNLPTSTGSFRFADDPYQTQLSSNILYEWREKNSFHSTSAPPWYKPQTDVTSIVVPIYNNLSLTKICIDSILDFTFLPHEIILIDNGSQEMISPWGEDISAKHSHITYIHNEQNQGFPQGCNQGIALSKGKHIILLNNDTMVTPGWLPRMISGFKAYPQLGIIGPKSVHIIPPNRMEHPGYTNPTEMIQFARGWGKQNSGWLQPKQLLAGLCLSIHRKVIDKIGGLDPMFGIGNMEEDDYAVRAQRAGFGLALAMDAFIDHVGGAGFKKINVNFEQLLIENHLQFLNKYRTQQDFDSHFSSLQKGGKLKQNRYHLALAVTKKFDPTTDYIPLSIGENMKQQSNVEIMWPSTKQNRWICFPKWLSNKWLQLIDLAHKHPHGPTIIVRIEPGNPTVLAYIFQKAKRYSENKHQKPLPQRLHFDGTAIPTTMRGTLYDAVNGLLSLPRIDAFKFEREAQTLQIPIYHLRDVATNG